ncbi:hypothetical protein Bbelb_094810 [Branchiostoma belcheri]|nr:hypothetical protein Bbelb_094810 [Branchiostoma belcheri]
MSSDQNVQVRGKGFSPCPLTDGDTQSRHPARGTPVRVRIKEPVLAPKALPGTGDATVSVLYTRALRGSLDRKSCCPQIATSARKPFMFMSSLSVKSNLQ